MPWELVVWQNEQLCLAWKAHHGPTSDGYEETKCFWKEHHTDEFELPELVDFCRKCHSMALFANYNGNTFSAIMRAIIDDAGFPAEQNVLARSLAGHIVAGVADEEELEAFLKLCRRLPGAEA